MLQAWICNKEISAKCHMRKETYFLLKGKKSTKERTVNQEHNSRVYTKTKLCHQANIPTKCLENEI